MQNKGYKKYRPTNGTCGQMFQQRYCDKCEHDRQWRESEKNPCKILNNAMAFDLKDPGYPSEWTYDQAGDPTCTAFLSEERAKNIRISKRKIRRLERERMGLVDDPRQIKMFDEK